MLTAKAPWVSTEKQVTSCWSNLFLQKKGPDASLPPSPDAFSVQLHFCLSSKRLGADPRHRNRSVEVLFESNCRSPPPCSLRRSQEGRQVATSTTTFCFPLHLSHSFAPSLFPFFLLSLFSTPLGNTFSPSTPSLHREKKSITLRSEWWRRHRLLCPADCPFPVCSVSWRAGSFSAGFMSVGQFSNFGPPEIHTHFSVGFLGRITRDI